VIQPSDAGKQNRREIAAIDGDKRIEKSQKTVIIVYACHKRHILSESGRETVI
jgi:hypothetical protein